MYLKLFVFIFGFIFGFFLYDGNPPTRISAFVRVKDEIKTVIPMLNSIDGIFDRIIIIHSNEPDDGSVKAMQEWCGKRPYCLIYEYPHAVIPSHDNRLKKVPFENTLAAYYQFGLDKFMPEEYVCKIDGDQIYMTERLKEIINQIRTQDKRINVTAYGMKGYNTYVHKGKLVKFKPAPLNGGKDGYIIKRKYFNDFKQGKYYEIPRYNVDLTYYIFNPPVWFHFMKSLKNMGKTRSLEDAKPDEIDPLTDEEKGLFEKYIRPRLEQGSPYKNLQL